MWRFEINDRKAMIPLAGDNEKSGTDKLAPNLPVFLSHDSIKNVSAPSIPT